MSKDLSIKDIAEILKVEEDVVTRLFDEGKLSGFRWGNTWRTSEELLAQDIDILTDETRISNLNSENHRTRWELNADERKLLSSSSHD